MAEITNDAQVKRTAVLLVELMPGELLDADARLGAATFAGWLDSTAERERMLTLQVHMPPTLTVEP